MTVDFSYLSALDVDSKETAELTLSISINDESPVLVGKFAGEGNTAYFNELLKSQSKHLKNVTKGNITHALVKETRSRDRSLYARHVITGWRNVYSVSKQGGIQEVPFSADNCEKFLESLPDRVFEEVRAFFSDTSLFSSSSMHVEAEELEELAKN